MLSLLRTISIICTILGLIIFVKTIIPLIKLQKQLKKMNPTDITPYPIRKKALNLSILAIVSVILSLISNFLNIFLR